MPIVAQESTVPALPVVNVLLESISTTEMVRSRARRLRRQGDTSLEQSTHLGIVDDLQVLTYGEPGQRTFNLTASSERGNAVVWLEKEQLYNIAFSLGNALEQMNPDEEVTSRTLPDIPVDSEGDVDFKAARIAMQYDAGRKVFLFAAAGVSMEQIEAGEEDPDPIILQFGFSHQQAVFVARRGMQIVAAGRPICPYCHIAINQDEDHVCERRNGHNIDLSVAILDQLQNDDD